MEAEKKDKENMQGGENNLEYLAYGLEILVIGFTVVMITLYVLYLILLGFSRCCSASVKPANGNKETAAVAIPAITKEEISAAPVAATASVQTIGTAPEIVAAITAAIAACFDRTESHYEIVSLQPATSAVSSSQSSAWAAAGRNLLMEKRREMLNLRRERRK